MKQNVPFQFFFRMDDRVVHAGVIACAWPPRKQHNGRKREREREREREKEKERERERESKRAGLGR